MKIARWTPLQMRKTLNLEVIDYETSETKIVDFDGLQPIDDYTYNEKAKVSIAGEVKHYKINLNGTNDGDNLIYQRIGKSEGENENRNKPVNSEDDKKENMRVCRAEKRAPCDICLRDLSTVLAVKFCVQCCIYYCDKHKYAHSSRLAPKKNHTEIAFNVTEEEGNSNFKLYLDEIKGNNLEFEFDQNKVSFSGLIDVNHKSSDSEKCFITGIVLLNDGRLTLVDRNNDCIKFLNLESQKITSYMHIPFKPRYLFEYEIGKGVVTCPENKILLLIDLNTHSIIKTIRVDGVCRCVVSLRNMFIVSLTDNIHHRIYIQIMNRDGKVLKLLRSRSKYPVFIEPYYLVVDKRRELFYVQDSRQSVFQFGRDHVKKV